MSILKEDTRKMKIRNYRIRQSIIELKRKAEKAKRKKIWTQEEEDFMSGETIEMFR